jgi:hypothetical protein
VALDGEVGHQEPYGFTRMGSAVLDLATSPLGARLALSHEEGLPPLVTGVDRLAPEQGIADHLEAYETAASPEARTAFRAEGRWTPERVRISLGSWVARVAQYRVDSNPLWVEFSDFTPDPYPGRDAYAVGLYGDVRLEGPGGISALGRARVHNRDSSEVPYLADWIAGGALHWRRTWFQESLDLDLAVGGDLLGRRRNPVGEIYPVVGQGYAEAHARVDNGVLTLAFRNLLDTFVESDLRDDDTVTPVPMAGTTFLIGLTMYLTD